MKEVPFNTFMCIWEYAYQSTCKTLIVQSPLGVEFITSKKSFHRNICEKNKSLINRISASTRLRTYYQVHVMQAN